MSPTTQVLTHAKPHQAVNPVWALSLVAAVSVVCGFVIGRSSSPEKVEQPVAQAAVIPAFPVTAAEFKANLAELAKQGATYRNVEFTSRDGRVQDVTMTAGILDHDRAALIASAGAVSRALGIERSDASPMGGVRLILSETDGRLMVTLDRGPAEGRH